MFKINPPASKREILDQLANLSREIIQYNRQLSLDIFLQPQAGVWSTADHVRHLIKSVRPLAMALKIPKIIIRFKFGRHNGASRSFDELKKMYRQKLNEGATAGRFAPGKRDIPVHADNWKYEIIANWQQVSASLTNNLQRWSEKDLDRYCLPHPLLGNLTVREMLFFTLYHNHHHARRVEERGKAAN